MNALLLERATGSLSPSAFARDRTTKLLYALQPAPHVLFDSSPAPQQTPRNEAAQAETASAHKIGVNALTIDKFEGRYALSGGADSSISLWDLEVAGQQTTAEEDGATVHRPTVSVKREASAHKFGITHLAFYPFDSLAFISSSYDHTLKIYSSETLAASASIDLDSVVYSHAMSPIASHLLVACATQHPTVRLVDLRSGASTHALVGHVGAVLTVAWRPNDENILASGGTDGSVRFWDVRRSAGTLGVLDMDDSVGVVGYDSLGTGARRRGRGRAHAGPVNGAVWTDSGQHMVTCGHDERIRVWDISSGANTLANFGPTVKNPNLSILLPVLAPKVLTGPGKDVMCYPNEREILMYELFEGNLIKRLRVPGIIMSQQRTDSRQLNIRNRVTTLAWRAHATELYSAHSDGTIRAWYPRTTEDAMVDEEDTEPARANGDDHSRKRKIQVLDDIYRDLTTRKVTFT